nr:hypothetical protein TetV2_00631 [Oceanusvirus sp.]
MWSRMPWNELDAAMSVSFFGTEGRMSDPPLRLGEVQADGSVHVSSLGPITGGWTGAELLRLAAARAKEAGARTLRLQDASYVSCGNGGPLVSLAVLSLIRHGRTWYERHGFVARTGTKSVSLAREAAEDIRRLSANQLATVLQKQITAVSSMPGDLMIGKSTARSVLWRRRRALAALRRAPNDTVGRALARMSCRDIAAVLSALVGNREESPPPDSVAGVATPGAVAFRRLSVLWVNPASVSWEKTLQ